MSDGNSDDADAADCEIWWKYTTGGMWINKMLFLYKPVAVPAFIIILLFVYNHYNSFTNYNKV